MSTDTGNKWWKHGGGMVSITENLKTVRERIGMAASQSGRSASAVMLLAVSKLKSVTEIREALEAGQRDFGENYLQEALVKIAELDTEDICWHFIGSVQSNKAKALAESFDWVHTVDRLKLALQLSRHRPIDRQPLQVCLQVNIDQDPAKSGCSVSEVMSLANEVSHLPGIQLRGLMAIPRANSGSEPFSALATLMKKVNHDCGLSLDTLSMGMSGDLELAVKHGSTIVRVGTDVFGKRP